MFLKTIALRGFKSFADRTVLELEPGITVIVGPNGSGKSNIVDALTWVLGSHSPKSLRGAAMSDVIFAGSGPAPGNGNGNGRRQGRAALGRASVDITIDNAAGTLPIEFREVTVGRAMFANGENTYRINDAECRLLDVQELLSDTGLGREHHTIVGQGQLDTVLNARPEDRRALIEEAAGILKHRRRKERALRKLDQMEGHLERLNDILRELRRQMRPLERQAEAAAKHAELAGALREVRVRRALRELAALEARAAGDRETSAGQDARLAALESQLAEVRAGEQDIERTLAVLTPRVQQAAAVHFRLSTLAERSRGLVDRIEERRAGLADAVEEPVAGRDPEQLRVRAAEEQAARDEVRGRRDAARAALAAATAGRADAERARRAHDQAAAAEARRRAESRERLLRWEGAIAAVRSSLAQAGGEQGRLAAQVEGTGARVADLEREAEDAGAAVARADAALGERRAAVEDTKHQLAARREAVARATADERRLERERAACQARADALRAAPAGRGSGHDAVRDGAAEGALQGIAGPVAEHLRVPPPLAAGLAAVLGPLGEATVVAGRDAAGAAVHFVLARGAGQVLLLPKAEARPRGDDGPQAAGLRAAGAAPLAEQVGGDEEVLAALAPVLGRAWLVDDYALACALAAEHPDLAFVTPGGALAGPMGYAGGALDGQGAVLRDAAATEAELEARRLGAELAQAADVAAAAERERDEAGRAHEAATAAFQAARGERDAAQARRRRIRDEHATAVRQRDARRREAAALDAEVEAQRARLADLERQGPQLRANLGDDPDGHAERGGDVEAERLEDALAAAREAEVEARLALGSVEQEGEEHERRLHALEREARDVEQRLAERERRRVARLAALERCRELAAVAAVAARRADASLVMAEAERDRLEESRGAAQRKLGGLRARLTDLEAARSELVSARHADELRRTELRQAIGTVRTRLSQELGLDPDAALAEALAEGTDDPGATLAGGEEVDAELAEREATLARKVELLGVVNPLALQEFTSVQERHRFLVDQIEDLRSSRRDLEKVVAAVDTRIREVFSAAFDDVAEQFQRLFPRLFPGGEGRLILTDPDDLLTTGVEVEARPAGKRVKRLSLLSGGERSLVALAVLFAIFAARPSPFYVLDEVEAALDDLNLQRFLDVVAEFAGSAQLLIVTHQKRTMEIADTLYGVSMRTDGVSKVVGQRVDGDREPLRVQEPARSH